MKTYKELTTDELEFIIENYRRMSFGELAEHLSTTSDDIHTAIKEWRAVNRNVPLARVPEDQYSDQWKQEVVEYYRNHSLSTTVYYFFTQNNIVRNVLKEYGIPEHDRATSLEFSKIEQYGSIESYNDHMIQKQKETSMIRYGTDNFAKTNIFKEKSVATFQKRYGVDNPMQSEDVKQLYMTACMEKYGVPWPQMYSEILQKRITTNEQRYGGNGWKSPQLRQKSLKTFADHYGGTHWRSSPELVEKINKTCRDKHGVDWPCLYPDVRNSFSTDSSPNKAFAALLETHSIEFDREFGINRYLYDFRVGNILIEINPSSTHNSTWGVFGVEATSKTYHREKRDTAVSSGYRCIHIWDWDNVDLVVQQLKFRPKVYARKCECRCITNKMQKEFTHNYHLQGAVNASIAVGLFHEDTLISVMTFGKPRYNKKYQYELLRYCSNYHVVGGAEKLFTYFIQHYNPESIISYCDDSKFIGDVYKNLGFTHIATNIGKHWYNMSTQKHVTDNLLRQRGFDQIFGTSYGKGTSNEELMLANKFVEIYDAGQSTYVWKQVD